MRSWRARRAGDAPTSRLKSVKELQNGSEEQGLRTFKDMSGSDDKSGLRTVSDLRGADDARGQQLDVMA